MVDVNISSPVSINTSTISSYSSNLLNPLRANTISSNRSPGVAVISFINTYSSNLLNPLRANTLSSNRSPGTAVISFINTYSSNLLNSIRANNLLISATSGSQSSLITEGQLFPRGNPLYSLERFSTYSLNIGLKSYFKFDGNTTDSIVVSRSFTTTNSPSYDIGELDKGIKFTATNQSCYIDKAVFPVIGQSFSVALWLYIPSIPSGGSNYFTIFSRGDFGFDYTTVGNTLRIYLLNSDNVTYTSFTPTFSMVAGSWNLFIISYDSVYQKVRFRANNVAPQLFNYTQGFPNTGTNFFVNGQSSSFVWLNTITDELGFWDNRIVSPSEEELLWNNGNGRSYVY